MNKRLLWLVCIFTYLASCQNPAPNSSITQNAHNFTYQIIAGSENTFGYDISVDGKKYIHQPFIPGLSGALGFKSAKQAEKVALFLIEKMKKGETRPNISPTELHQLGAF